MHALSDDMVRLRDGYAAAPLLAFAGDGENDIAGFRWRRSNAYSPGPIHYSLSSYSVSFVMRAMQAQSWFGDQRVFSGSIESDSFRIAPPGTLAWHTEEAYDVLQLLVPCGFMDSLTRGKVLHERGRLLGVASGAANASFYVRDPFATSLGRELVKLAGSSVVMASEQTQSLCRALIVRLLAHYLAEPIAKPRISQIRLRRVHDYIAENLDQDIAVCDLAAIAALSSSHFANAFSASVGMPPHRYVMKLRVERACEMLRDEMRSILSVALACGFKDPSHFSRVFRGQTGMSPRRYRLALGAP